MRYLLDTNICIYHLKTPSNNLIKHLIKINKSDIALCSVVKAELYHGVEKSKFKQANLEKLKSLFLPFYSFPFDDKASKEYAIIKTQLEKQGNIIGPNDLMIAAIAKINNLILITNNTKEFNRVEGLNIEDWSK